MKKKIGRPTKFEAAHCVQAKKLAILGATDVQIADFFNVNVDTILEWKKVHPEFSGALKEGKEDADNQVVKSLYQRAKGYSHEAVKIFNNEGAALVIPYTEHYPPDATSCIFWLKNRQPKEWRDKQEHEVTGKDGTPLTAVLQINKKDTK